MPALQDLVAQYPILCALAEYVSTLDLLNLALSAREYYARILSSSAIFERLTRTALCDGRGLLFRQNFERLYTINQRRAYVWGNRRKIWKDEPIEVRLYAIKCDEAGALPCRKCCINICEECRYYPREPNRDGNEDRRPHLNGAWQCQNVFCLCPPCDENLEAELKDRFLSELCTCSVPERWVCTKCVEKERDETAKIYQRNTIRELDDFTRFEELFDKTKRVLDHQFWILFICPCGAFIPPETRLRCTWCKRRHRDESEWDEEYREMRATPRVFEDPCYPPYVGDIYAECCDRPYPKLAYDGPIA